MKWLTLIALVASLFVVNTQARNEDCKSNGGTCVSKKNKKTSPADCNPLPYKCGREQTCCGPTDSKVGKGVKRKCSKTTKKCSKEGGTCVPTRNLKCPTFADDSLCKGASCTCCVNEAYSCNPLPSCRFRNGYCIRNSFSSECSSGNVDSSLCGSTKCGCCLRETNCNCGVANQVRIVGGQEVMPQNKYPWMAGLYLTSQDSYQCGATIINDRYVLTAAHCLYDSITGIALEARNIYVGLGDHKQYSTDDDVLGVTRIVEIEYYKVHENYDAVAMKNDIALNKLKEVLDLSAFNEIKPVCLPQNADSTYEGEDGIAAGWGDQDYNDPTSSPDALHEVTLPILSPDCVGKEAFTIEVTEDMLCAGYQAGGKDICFGDSGGPLMVYDGTRYTQVGIVSNGILCGLPNTPRVFTRVTSYLDWIMANTADASYCF